MMKRVLPGAVCGVALFAVALSGCSSNSSSKSSPSSSPTSASNTTAPASSTPSDTASSAAAAGATVATAKAGDLGTILVDQAGRTLYLFEADKTDKSTCVGACLAAWPPLLSKGQPTAGTGAQSSLLGTTKLADGTLQVTYNKHPLYYYAGDSKPGQTTGQGLNQFNAPWYVLAPSGKKVDND